MCSRLTERSIVALKARPRRYVVMDDMVPGLGVRVSPSGSKIFVLIARYNTPNPTRRSLGAFGKLTLDDARDKARDWHRSLNRGVDPKQECLLVQPFGEVAESFFKHIARQRRSAEVERSLRREVMHWKRRPISSITRHDVLTVVDTVRARGHQSNAHHVFGYMRRLFNFAIMRGALEHSPCDRIKASELIGPKAIRQRVLSDDELRALWEATGRLGYPYCHLYRLLLVTGQRRGEANGAKRREFDIGARLWTVPPERFKSNSTHLVPLSPMALGILGEIPEDCDPLFSVDGFSKNKRRLDKLMGAPEPFVIHDLRRTVRTRLSGLRVRTEVAEMIIGHGKKGLARIYDQHEYLDEMREALDAWANALSAIVASGT